MQTRCFLIRHGLTAANRQDRFAGRSDEPLITEGAQQLDALVSDLKSRGIKAVYCGPLTRTMESARILAQGLGVPMASRVGLNEINLPHWDGLSKTEIRQRFGPEYPTWLASPEQFQVPNCETIGQVQQRAVTVMDELSASHPAEAILVVSHLIVIRTLLLHHRRLPLADFRSIKIANGQVLELDWSPA